MFKRGFLTLAGLSLLFGAANGPSIAASPAAVAAIGNSGCKAAGRTGAIVGGLVGGILGHKVDRGVGTVVGAVAGGLLGSEIAKKLDKCEQKKMSDATLEAVNAPYQPGHPPLEHKWSSDSREGVNGAVTAGAPQTVSNGRECRPINQVSYINGEEVRQKSRVCHTPPQTNWEQEAA